MMNETFKYRTFSENELLMENLKEQIRLLRAQTDRLSANRPNSVKLWMAADSDTLECQVAYAVKDVLESGEIVIPSHYDYAAHPSGLDGMVAGVWKGEKVVVFIKTNHNLKTSLTKARCELMSTLQYWNELITSQGYSRVFKDDYKTMEVENYCMCKPMFALGGVIVPEKTSIPEVFSKIYPTFLISPNASGALVAEFIEGDANRSDRKVTTESFLVV